MTLFLTHTDLDGVSSYLVADYFSVHIDKLVFINYDELYDSQENPLPWWESHQIGPEFDKIIVTDISVNEKLYEWIVTHFKEYLIFDHHQRSAHMKDKENCYFDDKRSGAKLYFDYVVQHSEIPVSATLQEYIQVVDVYDRYDDEHKWWAQAQDLNRVFWQTLTYYREGYDKYKNFINIQTTKFMNARAEAYYFTDYEHRSIQEALEKEEKEYKLAQTNRQYRTDERGNKYVLWHGATKISGICYRMLQEEKDVVYIVNVNTYNGTKPRLVNGKLSVRSREGEYDVTQLQGINGHLSAGGGQFDVETIKKIWFNKDKNFPYRE